MRMHLPLQSTREHSNIVARVTCAHVNACARQIRRDLIERHPFNLSIRHNLHRIMKLIFAIALLSTTSVGAFAPTPVALTVSRSSSVLSAFLSEPATFVFHIKLNLVV